MRGSYLQVRRSTHIVGQADHKVTNLTPLELTELKPFLVKAMGMMQGLEPRRDDDEDGTGASQM